MSKYLLLNKVNFTGSLEKAAEVFKTIKIDASRCELKDGFS